MELTFPVLTLRVQGGRLLAPGTPKSRGIAARPALPHLVKFQARPDARRPRNAEGPREPAAAGGGGGRAAELQPHAGGNAAADPTGHRKQLKPRLCSSVPARLRGRHSGIRSVLSENPSRIPPSRVGSSLAFRCAFRSTSRGRKCRPPPLSRHSPAVVAVARRLAQGSPGSGVWRR